ncbi:AMP-binding protein [Oceanisphaera sp. KMM 10153]|uniref:AMP-binding protein n=1 Tax=Oceanisphaera submarina TaxID=3390193 RepID=UPI0039763E0F
MKEINTILDNTRFENIRYFDGQSELDSKDVDNCTLNLLAHLAPRAQRIQQGICILMERSAHYITTVMAAWKAGLYVIPLNTAWPLQKNLDIINRIKPAAVVVDAENNEAVNVEFKTLCSTELFCEPINASTLKDESSGLRPADVAYIIFTSGSTGEPKGVVISAASFRSYIDWTKRYFFEYSQSKRLLLTSELTFDITMGDLAFALAFGTSIGVARHNTNIPSVLAMIMKYQVDVLYSVPTTHLALTAFAKQKRGADISSINLLLSGGDRFPWQLVSDYTKLTQGAHFYNVYGPTEITINCFAVRLDNKEQLAADEKPVPIGECFDSLDFVLLNDDGEPDVEGELCVCGPQLLMGYYADDELTQATLTKDPRASFVNRPLYKTGDLAYMDNGLVYLKGRIDGLVKIRGYRIHPDEVSKVIDNISGVDVSAVVTFGDQSDAALAAFVRLNKNCVLTEDDINLQIEAALPSYMIPTHYEFVTDFPLNQSGKIDKKALVKRL